MNKPVQTLLSTGFFAAALAFQLPAVAEETVLSPDPVSQWLQLGAGISDNANGRFGQYSHLLQTDRLFGLGAAGYRWRDGTDLYRFGELEAQVDLEQTRFSAETGRQGNYRLGFDYRQFESISREDFTSVYETRGQVHSLPAGYTDLASATGFGGHAGLRREQGELNGQWQLGRWLLSAELASENKEGKRITGSSERFGDAVLLPAAIDQQHNTVDISARYQTAKWSINSGWYYSQFTNHDRSLTFANPVNTAADLRTLDLGPDNQFSRLSLDGFYRFAPNRQLSWFVSRGQARQDDRFLEPVLWQGSAGVNSLDAERVDTDARLAFRHQLTPRFSYRLQGDYRERDNRTPVLQLSASDYSHLYDHRRQRWQADARYRLGGGMQVRGGVDWRDISRITRARTTESLERFTDRADSTRLWAELRLPQLGPLSWSLRAETTDRDNRLAQERKTALNVNAPSQALPEYLLAGRQWQYRLQGDLPLSNRLLLAASYSWVEDDYDSDYFGMDWRDSRQLSLNLSWQAHKDLSLSLWGYYQDIQQRQTGREYFPGSPAYANADWQQDIEDDSVSLGFNLRWQLKPAIVATLDFSHSENDSSYSQRWLADADTGEAAGSGDQLPGYGVDVQRLDASLQWDYNPSTQVKLRYLYERYRSSDWAWAEDTFSVLGLGWNNPNYDAHALMVSVRYQFRDR